MMLKYSAGVAGVLFLSLILSNLHQLSSLPRPANLNQGVPPATEPLTAIVEKYAPFIYAATDARDGRQDLISNIDFDGDLVGNNNWENFDRFELRPTVYYSILETETHYFVSYHSLSGRTVDISQVPRFYDGDRLSGPLGNDRGISPFALDFSFSQGTLGALFFNPARRYAERLVITGQWSRDYVNFPFRAVDSNEPQKVVRVGCFN